MLTPRNLLAVLAGVVFWGFALTAAADDNNDFWLAARKGDAKAIEALLARGVNVNAPFRYNATALSYACDRGHTDVVKVLLAHGADVNVKDSFYGATPISWAVSKGHTEIVKMLLQKGATGLDDALMSTVFNRKIEITKAILEAGGLQSETLSAALARAVSTKNEELTELLKKHGAKPVEAKMQVPLEVLKGYEGTYRGEAAPQFVVTVEDGRLVASLQGQKVNLSPETLVTFRAVEFPAISLTFEVKDGKTTAATFKQGSYSAPLTRQEPGKQ